MPILTKEIEVKVNSRTINYYKSLGYEIPMKKASESSYKKHKKEYVYDFDKTFIVKVEDLSEGSNEIVEVLCDFCNKNIIKIPYYNYNKSLKETGNHACKECANKKIKQLIQEKYGVSNVAQLESSKEKMRKTNLERYETPYYAQTEECREKMKDTMKNKYGVEHYSQLPDYQEKFHNTCIERYGESYRKHFSEKAFNTFYEKTGYTNPSQSPIVREKVKKTCVDKFGCEYNLQSPEVRKKITQTLYANSSQKTSKQQRYLNSLYQGILNIPVKFYNADIYLPSDNLIVEYDGGGHLLNVITGRETQEEFNQKELIRFNIIKREGYKQMRIISSKDKLPSDHILLQMLSIAKEYFDTTSHTWMNFDIDNSIMINAENKDIGGIFFDYGKLRKIKETA